MARLGRSSVAVPGFVAGLEHAHAKYGSGRDNIDCCNWHSLIWRSVAVASKALASESLLNATQSKLEEGALEGGGDETREGRKEGEKISPTLFAVCLVDSLVLRS